VRAEGLVVMKEKENVLDPFENQLKEKDSDTLSQRALRLKRLQSLRIPEVATFRVWDYTREAKQSYINGCYRSCIIHQTLLNKASYTC
jgi:hypothetical protein